MAKKKASKKMELQKNILPKKSSDIPATKGHLDEIRSELKADITSLGLKMSSKIEESNSRFFAIDSRFEDMNSKFAAIDARFEDMNSKFAAIDARFE
ncbi:MAG: hypothetical protein KDD34_05220, partial [Bdellovibrionales bacterium]|nr:hypothetical protein [Bdellovibrionales bacterium]